MNSQKEKWNQFVIANQGSFLQSFEWGEFQESLGRKIWRIEIGEELKVLVIRHDLPLGKSYLYCPRPVLDSEQQDSFFKEIKLIAEKKRAIFFKIELLADLRFKIPDLKLIESSKQIQPQRTLILDLSRPEEELLSQMRQKTRYNIKLAEKKGVEIYILSCPFESHSEAKRSEAEESRSRSNNTGFFANAQNDSVIEIFWRLARQTAERNRFHLHPKIYYQKMLEILGEAGLVKLFIAKYKNQIIGANIICFFNETATYLHGASDYDFRRLMAPYLLQWQAILEAKKLGFKSYDFWGIDEKKWPGVTRFKRGFGGQEIVYPGAFDLVFRPGWYGIYNLVRKI